jgi:hypothetical protein
VRVIVPEFIDQVFTFNHLVGMLDEVTEQCRETRADVVSTGGPGKQTSLWLEQIIADDQ